MDIPTAPPLSCHTKTLQKQWLEALGALHYALAIVVLGKKRKPAVPPWEGTRGRWLGCGPAVSDQETRESKVCPCKFPVNGRGID